MRKYLSLFNLYARVNFWKVFWLFMAMTVAEIVLFFTHGAAEEAYLYDALMRIPTVAVIRMGAWVLYSVLIASMTDKGGRMNNLILRLGISEKTVYWIHVVYNTLIVTLFFLLQGLVYLLYCGIYAYVTPGELDPMSVFAAAYQHPVFHRFFPLHNVVTWMENVILILGFGICTAANPVRARRKMLNINSFILFVFAVTTLTVSNTNYLGYESLVFVMPFTLFCVFFSLWGVLSLEVDDYGKT